MLIGIIGKMGHGKTTFACLLRERIPQAAVLSFGKYLKILTFDLFFGEDGSLLKEDDLISMEPPSDSWKKDTLPFFFSKDKFIERIYGYVGQFFWSQNHDEISIDDVIREITSLWGKETKKVIRRTLQLVGTDIFQRFDKNFWVKLLDKEIDLLSRQGVEHFIIHDVRFPHEADYVKEKSGYLIRILRPNIQVEDNHLSEQALEDIQPDFTIFNEDLEDLKEKASILARGLLAGEKEKIIKV